MLDIPGVEPHYLLVVDRKGTLDILEVRVEVSEQVFLMRFANSKNWGQLSVKNWKALWESVRKFVWSNPNLLSEARARLKE